MATKKYYRLDGLREKMREREYTIFDLAVKTGISTVTIGKVLNGKGNLAMDNLLLVMKCFNDYDVRNYIGEDDRDGK